MDSIRAEEKAAYDTAKADLELGISGAQKALSVLREYYGSASASLAQTETIGTLMQQPAPPQGHSKASGAGGSIIDILEVVESDFAKNLAAEEAQEADAVADY